jgi:hypothetical protein
MEQLLFHLMYDGKEYRIVRACNPEQRAFIAQFLEYLIEMYSATLDECGCGDDMLKAYEIWSL